MYATLLLVGCIGQGLVTAFLFERYLIHRRVRTQLAQIPWWRHWLAYFFACLPATLVAIMELGIQGDSLVASMLVVIVIDALGTTVGVSQLVAHKRVAIRGDAKRR